MSSGTVSVTSAIQLRPSVPADRAFERVVYGTSRSLELDRCGWTEAEQIAFLDHQFQMQDSHYRSAFEGAAFYIITLDGSDAGRAIVHRGPLVIELMDIVLLPSWRGRGIGTILIRYWMGEAAAMDGKLRLWVERHNPAQRLYSRLGFSHVGDHGIHMELTWSQPKTAS